MVHFLDGVGTNNEVSLQRNRRDDRAFITFWSNCMKAIVRKAFGGPETLRIEEVPDPRPARGEVLVNIKAFGINRAEQYFRMGLWGEVDAISGIECVGEVAHDPAGALAPGQRVIALMGGMGRSRPGSYAQAVCVPAGNVVPVRSTLPWAELAALPESYATAWSCLFDNLDLRRGQLLLLRGATSALGQAALNLAAHAGVEVIATVRDASRAEAATALGARRAIVEGEKLPTELRAFARDGVDAVLDLVGTSTVLQSLTLTRRGGRVCIAGFLGGASPISELDPLKHLPSGRHLSFFGSAFVYGTPEYPLADVPMQTFVELAEAGRIKAKPARVFGFEEIQDAHRVLDANGAGGKIVVVH
jgi:NADPH:quinone reductase